MLGQEQLKEAGFCTQLCCRYWQPAAAQPKGGGTSHHIASVALLGIYSVGILNSASCRERCRQTEHSEDGCSSNMFC